ncbi:helix-turn-helix transcriptional regulator [Saccharopolyspora sp. 6V]|uniref:helix-turn-helix domain-containing protein n=1 Tax=Saccharopolyspora sp. 6V TaxID=2877239 RepID=UPI001CD38D03|nr:helix-turn-helix transcriptional regulator [Saccharopolyspora sp. 6V]MCA1195456.1 helix-turn-helix domain-containing protein [Saccharopolyspora sp. 6V]
MPRRPGPSARSRRLAQTLRKIRAEKGVSAAEVGKELGMSGSKINRIETCEIGIYLDDLEKLLDFHQVTQQRRVELLDIARHAEQRSWLRTRNAHFPADWQTWSDFEDEATGLRYYDPMVIPGLLQTSEYARAVIAGTSDGLSVDQIEERVASRTARRALLSRPEPLHLHVLIEEAALARPFGDRGCLVRQLHHLAEEASRPNVTVQIVPTSAGLHPGAAGAFIIVEYDGELSLIWLEQIASSLILEEDEQLDAYRLAWEKLSGCALAPDESVAQLRQMAVQAEQGSDMLRT